MLFKINMREDVRLLVEKRRARVDREIARHSGAVALPGLIGRDRLESSYSGNCPNDGGDKTIFLRFRWQFEKKLNS